MQGRDEEALKILKDGAKYNKATLPPDDQIKDLMRRIREEGETEAAADDSAEKTPKEKLYEAFKELIVLLETPEMRKRFLNFLHIYLPLFPGMYLFQDPQCVLLVAGRRHGLLRAVFQLQKPRRGQIRVHLRLWICRGICL